MWQVYLDMKAYAVALSHCLNPFQRDQVYLVQVMFVFLEINVKRCSYVLFFCPCSFDDLFFGFR